MRRHAAVLFVLALALPAHADSPQAAAFAAGTTAYENGDYATAIAAFEAAFRLDPRPEVAFTLAQAHRNQYFVDHDVTHLHRALGLYRHYLAEAPRGRRAAHARLHLETVDAILATLPPPASPAAPTPPPTQLLVTADAPGAQAAIDGGAYAHVPLVADVSAGVHRVRFEAPGHDAVELEALAVSERLVVVPASLRPQLASLVIRTEDDARIAIDGHAAELASRLTPGRHRITVVARGRQPATRIVDLAPGGTADVSIALAPTVQRRAARITLWGAVGLEGAALLCGTVAWLAQRSAESVPPPGPARTSEDLDTYNDALARRDTWRAASLGFVIGGAVAAATGAALYYFDVPRAPEPGPTLVPGLGPETVGAILVGRF